MTVLSSQLHTKFTHHNRAVLSRNTNIVYNFLFFFFFFDYLLFNLCLCVHSVRNPSGFTIGIFEYEYTHTAQPIWDDQTKIWTLLVFVAAVTSLEPFFVAPKISRSPNSIFAVQMLCSTRVFIQKKSGTAPIVRPIFFVVITQFKLIERRIVSDLCVFRCAYEFA